MKRRQIKPYCVDCGRPFRRGHKWFLDGCNARHKDCENPKLMPLQRTLFAKGEQG
jgi:hypothetical protein